MKNFLYFILIILLTFSCSKKNELSENDFSVDWFIEHNNDYFKRIKTAVEENGNRKKDSIIVAKSNKLIKEDRAIMNSLNEINKEEQIQSLLEVLKDDPQIETNYFDKYFGKDNINDLSLIEIKRRILMHELESLSFPARGIGEDNLAFDKLDIYFISDENKNLKNEKIKGRLILTAMSERIGEHSDFYFGGEKLKVIDGYGVVDLNRNKLTDKDSIELKVKFPEWELKKMIRIK